MNIPERIALFLGVSLEKVLVYIDPDTAPCVLESVNSKKFDKNAIIELQRFAHKRRAEPQEGTSDRIMTEYEWHTYSVSAMLVAKTQEEIREVHRISPQNPIVDAWAVRKLARLYLMEWTERILARH